MYKHLPRKPKVGDVVRTVSLPISLDNLLTDNEGVLPKSLCGREGKIVNISLNGGVYEYSVVFEPQNEEDEEEEAFVYLPEIKSIKGACSLDKSLFEM